MDIIFVSRRTELKQRGKKTCLQVECGHEPRTACWAYVVEAEASAPETLQEV